MSTLVGVCGGSGSGKTTLARRLVDELGNGQATSVSFDSYYRDHGHLSVEERAAVNFDHPDSLDVDLLIDHLRSLKRGDKVAVPVYDFATHTRSGDFEVIEPQPFVIIEGILLFSSEIVRDTLDCLIFRDCPEDVRAGRRMRRDIDKRGRTPASVRTQWETTVLPMHAIHVAPFAHHADIVTTSDQDLDDIVRVIAATLRKGHKSLEAS